MISFIKDNRNFWTVVVGNRSYQFDSTHKEYSALVQLIKDDDESAFVALVDKKKVVNEWGSGDFTLIGGILRYKNEEVHQVIGGRILEMIKEGFDCGALLKFLERLYKNPSYRAINELYKFLENKFLPITPDGCFLAYKAVTANFKDKYSGIFDNSVGQIPEMPRGSVDDDCSVGCSRGLHVGDLSYVNTYKSGDDVIVICKVDPMDVVSVPKDESNRKVRCCKYGVIGIFEGALEKSVVNDESPYTPCGASTDDDDDDDDDDDYYDYNSEDEDEVEY